MTIDWKECCNSGTAKNVKPDLDLIKSLVKSSNNKLESESRLEMSKITSSSKISLAYDSLREMLEALAIKNGYKIYNHECYSAFLKEIIKESEKGDDFDEIRKVRNAINYYGKEISEKEADKIISKIKTLRIYVNNLLGKNN